MQLRGAGLGLVLLVFGCGGSESAPPTPDGGPVPDSAVRRCQNDTECDDGNYCNGPERCAPGTSGADPIGCIAGTRPCGANELCEEASDRCRASCDVSADADADGANAIACGGIDCNDTDPGVYPGATEICDPNDVDEDCDPTTFGTTDRDDDGYVDAACCNVMGSSMICGDDCSDTRRDMRPGFAETCDFLDNDCDGTVDETAAVDGFADMDRDLHGDPSMPMRACADTPGFSTLDDDCNDDDPEVHGAQLEICDRKDNNCNGMTDESPASVTWYADDDDDGFGIDGSRTVVSCDPVPAFSLRPSDCDDMRRDVNPAARELCNGGDDDCDGVADFMIRPGDFEDDDGDGYADATCGGNDCDDARGDVHPGALEICDGVDNDCNGVSDGADAMAQWYLDLDGDGYGDESMPAITSCTPQPARVPRGGDCDDSNAAIRPGAADICDEVDGDCDNAIDEDSARFAYYADVDGDGWGESMSAIVFACIQPRGRALRPGDCDDNSRVRYPGAPELCDLSDNDCDMMTDENAPRMIYPDTDRDGYGVMQGAIVTCETRDGYAEMMGDCDDGNPARHPDHEEICDLIDNDCDGMMDEDGAVACRAANGTGTCVAGRCQIASCMTGFSDCDATFSSGCETNTQRSPQHCGGCGMACDLGDTCGRGMPGRCDDAIVSRVFIGESHSLALRSTGTLLGWGYNNYGQVGTGATANQAVPVPVLTDVADVTAGDQDTCAVTSGRRAFCWGSNTSYQLGDGTNTPRPSPVRVMLDDVVQISLGTFHTCARTGAGAIWCWGQQRFGQVGDVVMSGTARQLPFQVPGINDAIDLHAGFNHTCVMRPLGGGGNRVQCWGAASAGAIGDGTTTPDRATPTDVIGLPPDVVAFGRGYADYSCVRTSSGTARCWGNNFGGHANGAVSSGGGAVPTPVAMTLESGAEATGIADLCVGWFMSCALRTTATPGRFEVWCSGFDDFGQLGNGGMRMDRGRLGPVLDPTGMTPLNDAVAVACGRNHVCAARADGSVWCWGSDQYENLGNGPGRMDASLPVPVTGF